MRAIDFFYVSSLLAMVAYLYYIDRKAGIKFFEPVQLFLVGWFVSLTLILVNFVTYERVLNGLSFSLTFAFIIAFWGGGLIACRQTMGVNLSVLKMNTVGLSRQQFVILLVLSLVFMGLSAREVLEGLMSIGSQGLGEVRSAHWEELRQNGSIGLMRIVSSILNSCAFILALYLPFCYMRRERRRGMVCAFVFLYLALHTISVGGRAALTYIVFIYVIVFLTKLYHSPHAHVGSKERVRQLKFVALGVGGLLFMYFIFGYFNSVRNENLAGHYNTYLAFQQHAYISDWVHSIFGNNDSVLSFAYGLTYFTNPLPGFTLLVNDRSIAGAYYWGVQSFDFISKLEQILISNGLAGEAKDLIATVLLRDGLYAINPWATFLRDLVMDFGYVGGIVVAAFIGWGSTKAVRLLFGSRRYFDTVFALILMLAAFIMALRGPFNLTVVSNSLVLLAVIIVFYRTAKSPKRLPPPNSARRIRRVSRL